MPGAAISSSGQFYAENPRFFRAFRSRRLLRPPKLARVPLLPEAGRGPGSERSCCRSAPRAQARCSDKPGELSYRYLRGSRRASAFDNQRADQNAGPGIAPSPLLDDNRRTVRSIRSRRLQLPSLARVLLPEAAIRARPSPEPPPAPERSEGAGRGAGGYYNRPASSCTGISGTAAGPPLYITGA